MKTSEGLRSERFEVSFNRIHQELKKMVKNESTQFGNLVYKGAKTFSLIRTYQEELHQFRRLRNAIVHNRYEIGQYIAEPHEETVRRIEKISEVFSKPSYALSIATKQVIWYDCNDSITNVILGIQNYSYSQYPVYQNGYCIGLLTARAIVKWMAENVADSVVDLSTVKVIDICRHEINHPIFFASKSINIFEIEEIFEAAHLDRQDLEAVIVTEHGKKDEKPLGVITPWDLIELDYSGN